MVLHFDQMVKVGFVINYQRLKKQEKIIKKVFTNAI